MSQATSNPPAAAAPRPRMETAPPVRSAAAHHPVRDEQFERRRRHTIKLLAASALGLIPWTVILGLTLPSDYQVHSWRVTWVGFDLLLLTAFAATAVLGFRRHRAVVIPALASAVLLVCDAWFDASLAVGTPDVWASAGLALFVELPTAAYIFRRAYKLLHLQWSSRELTGCPDADPPR
ncbi:hypothetical protein AB0I54_22575 [Streptomyces sp. NPDC050625]|uniref:hypothetical protein n=1 Tax=Streptomyces sp. NPDC050625 TaxID=3154629 RepID=UPI003421F4CF